MRIVNADEYMAHLRANIDTTADIVDEQIKKDEPIGTVKDGGQIGYLLALQWARSSLEQDCYTVEAIPKAEYENHLKADLVTMLEEIDLEMSEQSFGIQTEPWEVVEKLRKEIIQQKINALKSESEGKE